MKKKKHPENLKKTFPDAEISERNKDSASLFAAAEGFCEIVETVEGSLTWHLVFIDFKRSVILIAHDNLVLVDHFCG